MDPDRPPAFAQLQKSDSMRYSCSDYAACFFVYRERTAPLGGYVK